LSLLRFLRKLTVIIKLQCRFRNAKRNVPSLDNQNTALSASWSFYRCRPNALFSDVYIKKNRIQRYIYICSAIKLFRV